MWEVKKISRFLPTGHGILPSCGSKARETMVAKCELVLWGASPVDWIYLKGPLQPSLAENISLHSSNCNILGLVATVAFIANEARFTQIKVFFRACSLQNEVGDPPIFFIFQTSLTHHLSKGKIFRKKSMLENFRANVLNKSNTTKNNAHMHSFLFLP